ncbi:hypothetical protein Q8F55_006753 [Vanrija albida]|uniref:Uncharacterized protein n=1 Tax=Vanrija albida TaxID=181172 RepID=A0ABR3PY07_9TREE
MVSPASFFRTACARVASFIGTRNSAVPIPATTTDTSFSFASSSTVSSSPSSSSRPPSGLRPLRLVDAKPTGGVLKTKGLRKLRLPELVRRRSSRPASTTATDAYDDPDPFRANLAPFERTPRVARVPVFEASSHVAKYGAPALLDPVFSSLHFDSQISPGRIEREHDNATAAFLQENGNVDSPDLDTLLPLLPETRPALARLQRAVLRTAVASAALNLANTLHARATSMVKALIDSALPTAYLTALYGAVDEYVDMYVKPLGIALAKAERDADTAECYYLSTPGNCGIFKRSLLLVDAFRLILQERFDSLILDLAGSPFSRANGLSFYVLAPRHARLVVPDVESGLVEAWTVARDPDKVPVWVAADVREVEW